MYLKVRIDTSDPRCTCFVSHFYPLFIQGVQGSIPVLCLTLYLHNHMTLSLTGAFGNIFLKVRLFRHGNILGTTALSLLIQNYFIAVDQST